MPEPPRVYISAAGADAALAGALAHDLGRNGLAPQRVPLGDELGELTAGQRAAIAACPWFLVVQSPNGERSATVRTELAEAVRLSRAPGRGIIAMLAVPASLPLPGGVPVRIQVVDAVAQSYPAALQEITELILGPTAGVAESSAATVGDDPAPSRTPARATRRELLIGGGIIAAGLAVASGAVLVRNLPLGGQSSLPPPPRSTGHLPGTLIAQLVGHGDKVNGVAWSPDGTRIATASDDHTAKIWPSGGGNAVVTYRRHGAAVNTVAWSHDSQRVATASTDKTVQVWSAGDGSPILTFPNHKSDVAAAFWSPLDDRIASCDDTSLLVWRLNDGAELTHYDNPGNGYSDCTWSLDGHAVAASSWDKTVKIFSSETHAQQLNYTNQADLVFSVAWSPDGQLLASAGSNGHVHVWRRNGTDAFVYTQHGNAVLGLAWSPDSRYLATAGGDGMGYGDTTVRVWQATTGVTIATYGGHTRYVNSVAWSPDGSRVVSASDDGTAHIWWVS